MTKSDPLIFSQAGVFRLQQMANLIYRHTGLRHRLSSPEDQTTLIRSAQSSPHFDVRQCCQLFTNELNKRQLSALASRGVVLRPMAKSLHQQAG